ncbi:MAG: copper homeostasis protein CutC [Gemmatimonadales bacterium]
MNTVLVEAAVDSVESARAATRVGADRLELCARLDQEGLTPDADLLAEIGALGVPAFVMIRPRPGDFHYSEAEAAAMLRAIEAARAAGAAGIVTGGLTRSGAIDRGLVARLVEAAAPLPVTLHRAFDLVPEQRPALAELGGLGVRRVLTSGGQRTAFLGREHIRALVSAAPPGLTIVAGGGVIADVVERLIEATGVVELHLAAVRFDPAAGAAAPKSEPDPERLRAVLQRLGR